MWSRWSHPPVQAPGITPTVVMVSSAMLMTSSPTVQHGPRLPDGPTPDSPHSLSFLTVTSGTSIATKAASSHLKTTSLSIPLLAQQVEHLHWPHNEQTQVPTPATFTKLLHHHHPSHYLWPPPSVRQWQTSTQILLADFKYLQGCRGGGCCCSHAVWGRWFIWRTLCSSSSTLTLM